MGEIGTIPLAAIEPCPNAGVYAEARGSVVLLTPPQQWAHGAQARLDLPGIEREARTVRIRVAVTSGILGIGWLQPDQSAWIARTAAEPAKGESEIDLVLPAGTLGGRLVFENRTAGDRRCRAIIRSIGIIANEPPGTGPAKSASASALEHYRAALCAEERGDTEAAVDHYKAALTADPALVEAIAGLGRLRFRQPQIPLTDEIKRRAVLDACEVVVQVRNPCNYRCFYCVAAGHNNEPVERLDLAAVDRAYSQVNAKLIVTSLECGGGEPTVHPQFAELVRICSRYGAVSFPSNNSQDPQRWLPRETASRIFVRSALHPESEPNIDRYFKYARYLLDAGCDFSTLYIAHPTRMAKIPEYRELFAKRGVSFTPVSFIGEYEGRSYPHAYSEEERRLVGLHEESRYWLHRIEPHVTRIRNFRGIPCIAGYHSIYITKDGSLRRCIYDPARVLPAPLQDPEPCGVGNCGCGLLLEKLNSTETIDFYNYWAPKVGLEPVDIFWSHEAAQRFGYEGVDEALTAEALRMYDALMAAYGKDEFSE